MARPPRECAACGRPSADYYPRHPRTGRLSATLVWCADCYERAFAHDGEEFRRACRGVVPVVYPPEPDPDRYTGEVFLGPPAPPDPEGEMP